MDVTGSTSAVNEPFRAPGVYTQFLMSPPEAVRGDTTLTLLFFTGEQVSFYLWAYICLLSLRHK